MPRERKKQRKREGERKTDRKKVGNTDIQRRQKSEIFSFLEIRGLKQ